MGLLTALARARARGYFTRLVWYPGKSLVQAIAMSRDPEAFLGAHARAADPFVLKLPGLARTWMTGSADGAREIFGAPRGTFAPTVPNPIEPLLGAGSLILLEGDRHQRERKLLAPAFAGQRMRAAAVIVQRATLREIDRWAAGGELDLVACAQRITLDVILEAVFGLCDADSQATFREAIVRWLHRYTPPLMLMPVLRHGFGGLGPWAAFQRDHRAFDALLDSEITRRRELPDQGDTLSVLLAMRDDGGTPVSTADIKDQLRTLLVAGHETSAVGIGWALHFAVAMPEVRERVMAELAPLGASPHVDALLELPYLGALCDEALRLHPVVPVALRRVIAPFSFRGHAIAVGENVGVAICALHADPGIWGDPDVFRPQRFLDRTFSPHEYAPYGGGNRRCIGAAFARQEMQVAVGTILATSQLATVDASTPRPVIRNIISAPRRPLRASYVKAQAINS